MAGIFDPGIFDSGIFDTPAGGTTFNRTADDSLSSLTETVSRVATLAHTVSDTVATLTESPARIATYARTIADSLSAITEAVVAGLAFVRTVADSLSTLSEAVTRAVTFSRTVSQTLGAISESVSRGAMSVARTVSDTVSSVVEYVLDLATPYIAGTAIYLDGINIAKPDGDPVLYASARFTSAVNGVAGTCSFRVRDDLGTAVYLPGQPLELIIDGQRVWTGFVSSAKRVYVFPAINISDFGLTRFFDIEGVDLNILFAKRIAFQQSAPADILAPLYGSNTPDVTVISELVSNWLDLSGDALDISTLVDNVGDINENQAARAWEGSDTWGQAMTSIGLLPAAIFYLDPTRHLVYCDTDTPTAPFGLSDAPDGITSKGYREMEILLDGTNLANDVMCWGIGYGSSVPVFKRDQDATSQADHGLWQLGQLTYGVFKQATIDRIADSILNGSPDHHRGAKDDRPAVTIVTHESGLLPAQKVIFESTVFGWSDVLPIRKMEVTFETPDKPRYELTLSHEIDTPWSFFDPWIFSLPGFGFGLPPFQPAQPGSPVQDCGPDAGVYEVIDDYNRTSAFPTGGWNTATCGRTWTGSGSQRYTDGAAGHLASSTASHTSVASEDLILASFKRLSIPFDLKIDVTSCTIGPFTNPTEAEALFGFTSVSGVFGGAFIFHENIGDGMRSYVSGSNSGAILGGAPWAIPFSSGIVTIQCTSAGITANGIFQEWLDGSFNPTTCPDGTQFNALSFALLAGSSIVVNNIEAKDTSDWGTFCTDVPGGVLIGPLCEVATRVDSTHYQLTRTIAPGSTNVYVGTPGVLYHPGMGFDYTVNDDTALITFNDTITLGTRVYVCYVAAGPIA